ncbi:MAG: hypothetical protein Q7R76_00580 [Candidatus Woesearchaeota archaeon]|nr:hypothetical protein [Candidatus Woesearchaeota archaeon]
MEDTDLIRYVTLVFIAMIIFIIITSLTGISYITTDNGSHVGYVTAVEDNGLFFKTTTVYFKSDVQSTQEDKYCVINAGLKSILKGAAQNHNRIEIQYYDQFSKDISELWRGKDGDV